jgi:signal transduction histidine kinase
MTAAARTAATPRSWLALLGFGLIYLAVHILLDRVSKLTTLSDGISLWFPTAGLILAAILRFRLIGVVLVIISSVTSFLLFRDRTFELAGGLAYCVLAPFGPLLIRSVMRRVGVIDPRTVPRPTMTMALIVASACFALWNVLLANFLVHSLQQQHTMSAPDAFRWWLGDFVGALSIGSFALQVLFPLMLGNKRISWRGIQIWLPRLAAYGMLSLLPWALHFVSIEGKNLQLAFLAAIPIFYAALRRGSGETSLALAFANLGFMLAAHRQTQQEAVELQALALMINILGVLTTAITTNQKVIVRALRQTLEERDQLTAKQAEYEKRLAESQRLDALGQMAGGLAHEINNLLHPIKSFARSAATAAEDKRLHYLGRIQDCADSAQRIVADVLTFARDDKVASPATPEIVDAQTALSTSLGIAANALPTNITLQTNINLEGAHIRCDVGGMSQVLVNLVNNARDAMPEGGSITITGDQITLDAGQAALNQLPDGGYVRVRVADTGEGMTAEVARRVFEPFYTTKDIGRGTGLGLSVVYGILRRWGGAALVESFVGVGATFTLLIPLASDGTQLHN